VVATPNSVAATAAVMIFFDIGFSSLLLLLAPKKKSIRGRGTAAPPAGGRWTAGGDDRHRTADQMPGQFGQSIALIFRPGKVDRDIPALDKAAAAMRGHSLLQRLG